MENFEQSFKKTANPSAAGFYLTEFEASYKDIEAILGEPNGKGDNYKVSTEWVLENARGDIVYIYDWKLTNLYDEDFLSIEQLKLEDSIIWNIGGLKKEVADNLKQWLQTKGIL